MNTKNLSWSQYVIYIAKQLGLPPRSNITKSFIEWMKSKENINVKLDPLLWLECFKAHRRLLKDNDFVCVITGEEGSGKSTIATQINSIISSKYRLASIIYSFDKMISNIAANEYKKFDSIHIDEGALVALSRNATTKVNKTLLQILSIARVKGWNISFCIPSFRTLETYVREHRVQLLIHVSERGKYIGIKREGINIVNDKMKRDPRYKPRRQDFGSGMAWLGYFSKGIPKINDVNEKSYLSAKLENINSQFVEWDNAVKEKRGDIVAKAAGIAPERKFYKFADIAKTLGYNKTYARNKYLPMYKDRLVKGSNQKWQIPREVYNEIIESI